MLLGTIYMLIMLGVFAYVSMEGSAIHTFKRQHPSVGILAIVVAGCFVTYALGSLIVFMLGILLPICGKIKRIIDILYFCI